MTKLLLSRSLDFLSSSKLQMRTIGQAFFIDSQILFAVDRQEQMVAAQAEVFDAGGGEFLLGSPHDATRNHAGSDALHGRQHRASMPL